MKNAAFEMTRQRSGFGGQVYREGREQGTEFQLF
jgi:hypothetical protein